MAGPGGREAGRVTVKVVPDTSRFASELKRELQGIDDVEVNVRLNTALAMADFAALKRRIESNSIEVGVDIDRNRFSGIASSIGKIGSQAASSLGSMQKMGTTFIKTSSTMKSSVSNMLQSVTSMRGGVAGLAASVLTTLPKMTLMTTLFAGIAGAAISAVGAITAGIGGLPAVLTTVAAPIGAIVAGFDGIKNAASALKPELESLRSSVSATFQQGLSPVFENLRSVFPVLQEGLNGMARTLSTFAGGLVEVITSSAGLENIRSAFEGASIAVNAMAPGMKALVGSMLEVAGMTPLYEILGATLNDMATGLASFFDQVTKSDAFIGSLEGIRDVLQGVGSAIGQLAIGSMEFFNQAAPGIAAFAESLGNAFGRIDWETLGASFGRVMTALSEGLNNIPQGVLDALGLSFQLLGQAVQRLVDSGGLTVLIGALTGVVMVSGFVVFAIGEVVNILSRAWQGFMLLGSIVGQALTWLGNLRSHVMQAGATFTAVLMGVIPAAWNGAVNIVRNAVNTVVNTMRRAWDIVATATRNAWNDFKAAIRGGIDGAIGFVRSIPGRIMNVMGNLGGLLVGAGRSLIEGFARGIRNAIGSAVSAARSAVSQVRSFFPFSPAKEGPFSGTGYTSYSGRALVEDWAAGIEAGTGTAVRAIDNMMNAANNKATAEWRGHISSDSFGGLSGAVHDGVLAAFNGSKLTVDGNGMAKVVNNVNARNKRR